MSSNTKPLRKRQDPGTKPEVLDRRREVWALRAQGWSYAGIAERVGVSKDTVARDARWCAEEWGGLEDNSREAVKGQLTELLRRATGLLVQDIENQAQNGQVIHALNGDGTVIGSQQKLWLNPQSLGELGRTIERMAKITGVMDTGIDAGAGSVSNVAVVLPAPMGGVEFADATARGALNPEGAVNTASQPVPEETGQGHSSGPEAPEALT